MSIEEQPEQEVEFRLDVPPEHEAGVYANLLFVWHTAYEFTLDFAVSQPAEPPAQEGEPAVIPCRVVARVKLPPAALFDAVLRAINAELNEYEKTFGEIRRPQPPEGDQE